MEGAWAVRVKGSVPLEETPTPCEAPERGSAVTQKAPLQQDVTAPVPPACTEQLLGRGLCWALGCTGQQVSRGPRPTGWGDE